MSCTHSSRSSIVLLTLASLMGACVIPKSVGEDPNQAQSSSGSIDADGSSTGGDATPGSTSGASGPLSTTTSAETSGGTDPAGSEDTGLVFLMTADGGPGGIPCDPWQQNCPDGEKCSPMAKNDAPGWNSWRCSPVPDNPDAVGEPCVADGSPLSGIDSCEFGAFCWEVDPETLEGTCVALCTGHELEPICPDTDTCFLGTDGVLTLCLDRCDPLLQDCAPDHACYPGADGFACLPEGFDGPGVPGDSCEDVAACDLGNACVGPEHVPGCAVGYGCCTALCSISDPMPSCLAGQVCTPWFQGSVPAGYEDVGFCALP